MAMTVTLRDKIGNELLQKDIGPLPRYPEIIKSGDLLYVMKTVSRDKKTAMYVEADILDITVAK